MKSKLLDATAGRKTYALVFDKGEEVTSGLKEFAQAQQLAGSHFTAIGAFSRVTLGFFDRASNEYKKIPVNEQVEVLSLIGNIGLYQDEPRLHAHVVIGKSDGMAMGGHLLQGDVWPTLEVIIEESPRHLQRHMDEETGLPLLDLSASQAK
jgi:uncharacterized protein